MQGNGERPGSPSKPGGAWTDPEEDERSFLSSSNLRPKAAWGPWEPRSGIVYPLTEASRAWGADLFTWVFFNPYPQIQGDLSSSPLAAV